MGLEDKFKFFFFLLVELDLGLERGATGFQGVGFLGDGNNY